jgi:hypothetical protein
VGVFVRDVKNRVARASERGMCVRMWNLEPCHRQHTRARGGLRTFGKLVHDFVERVIYPIPFCTHTQPHLDNNTDHMDTPAGTPIRQR